MKKKLYISLCFSVLCLFLFPVQHLPGAEKKSPEQKIAKNPELESLSNEELLKQTAEILDNAKENTFSRLRAHIRSETLLQQARENAVRPDIPEKRKYAKKSVAKEPDPLESAKIQTEQAKKDLEFLEARQERLQTEKVLSDEYIRQTDNALSAIQSLLNSLDSLHLYLLEIRLRVEDGTISREKIPDMLSRQSIQNLRKYLTAQQQELRGKTEKIRKEAEQILSRIEKGRTEIIAAQAALSGAEKKYGRELKRRTLEKEFSDQSPEKLLARISEAEEERILLSGAFNLSHNRFIRIREKAQGLQKEAEMHREPESGKDIQIHAYIRSEEADQIIGGMEELAAYYEAHIQKLEQLAYALESLIKQGEIFQGDATVLAEHLFTMQVLLTKLADRGAEKQQTEIIGPEELAEAADSTSGQITDAMTAVQEAGKTREQIAGLKEEAKKKLGNLKEKLPSLKKTRDSARQARQWASELEKLTAEQLTGRFRDNQEELEKSIKDMEDFREKLAGSRAAADEIQKKTESLKDPLLRIAQQEALEEKYTIQKQLRQMANLEFLPAEGKDPENTKAAAAIKKDAIPEVSLSENWQNLLATRAGILAEKQKLRTEMAQALQTLNQKNDQYAAILSETAKLAMQHHATALELKKRLGRRELEREMIPDGITEALQQPLLPRIESETAELMTHQTLVRQQLKALEQPDEVMEQTGRLINEVLNSIGKRLDLLKQRKELAENFERKEEDLSETERKELHHATIRRMEVEDTMKEFFLSFFVPSQSAENLTELLRIYYRELIRMEFRRINLEKQKEITDHLIVLAEAEKKALSEILPFLQKDLESSRIRKEEEWVQIRSLLMPEKAGELIADFKSRTGQSLTLPPPIPEEKKADAADKASASLFERHIEQLAAKKWLDIFRQRISPLGIEGEIGKYRDEKSAMDTASLAIERREKQLSGHPRSDLEKLTEEEKPKNREEMQRFLEGETAALRADRYKIWIQKAMEVFVKLAVILVTAVFLHWLTNFLGRRFSKNSQKSGKRSHTVVILPLLKTFFKFFIWIVTSMTILSSLGFNVGAILAGFGIGGLAIAMAAKESLSDIIGGISILLAKSVRPGDVILYKGEKNDVEEVGLRYARLRPHPSQFLVTIPNSLLAQAEIVNVLKAPQHIINTLIPLSNRNSEEKISLALQLVSDIINKTPDLQLKRVKFANYDNYSFNLSLRYIILDYEKRHTLQSEFNREVIRQFAENGIAFPLIPHAEVTNIGPDQENTGHISENGNPA
ncbi:MAG: mechanosensitive ion channel domain-containing protein [Desulfococcaceae bacterium]|jgi:MscS family membrane protein|nr:mechanosensitive ion channel domain-containing protein [Desulfococcaceae bacterium]